MRIHSKSVLFCLILYNFLLEKPGAAVFWQICKEPKGLFKTFSLILAETSAWFSLYPCVGFTGSIHFSHLTPAIRRQSLACNIMHRQSHQSPQCRTLSTTQAPASQDRAVCQRMPGRQKNVRQRGRQRGGKQTIINCASCTRHPRVQLEVTLVSNCYGEIDNKWKDLKRKCGFLLPLCTSKNIFLWAAGGSVCVR